MRLFHSLVRTLDHVHLGWWLLSALAPSLASGLISWLSGFGALQTTIVCSAAFVMAGLLYLAVAAWWISDPVRAVSLDSGRLPLAIASKIAYETLETTDVGREARSYRLGPIAFMAQKLWFEIDTIWGRRPESRVLHPIHQVAGAAFDFAADGSSLRERERVIFEGLCVDKYDFRAALHRMKTKHRT